MAAIDETLQSRTVELVYSVPVFVTVDLDSRTVTKVQVIDEAPEYAGPPVADAPPSPWEPPSSLAEAHEIAENADWPLWEIG